MRNSAAVAFFFLSLATAQDDQARDDFSGYQNREVLLGLFEATGGFDWVDSTNWFQQRVDVCEWNGIFCYPEGYPDERRVGHVRDIRLSNNNLVGTVPANVFSIPYLQSLDVGQNPDLDVDFSAITDAQFLEHLNIGETGVSNIDLIGGATNLQTLHITGLGLTGSPPSGLFQLSKLAALFANDNSFSGPLPTAIGLLTNLDEIYLYGNDFTGQIPSEIGRLSFLEILTLSQNAFGGTLPTELNLLTDLQILAISREDDNPKGPGISGRVPALKNHEHLTQLNLENQQLSGQLDPDFLLNCPVGEDIDVDLTNNQLTGTVPGSLASKPQMSIYLADNQFTAVSSDIYDVTGNSCPDISDWMDGAVGQLGCNAFLCPPGTWAPEGRSTTDDSCASCSEDTELWGRTSCEGTIPSDVQERGILISFYNAMGGRTWKADDNWLSLDVEVCDWFGIDCNQDGQVSSIIMRDNGLSGTFPQEVFLLPALRNLNLNSNAIHFEFLGISVASNMETLDLGSTGLDAAALSDVKELSSLVNLRFLSLASNDLGGTIPLALYGLINLEEIDVSYNNFNGKLEDAIGVLSNLRVFSCAGNMLTGQLPSQIGVLTSLQEFSAGENRFSGTLPTQLNSLTNLRSLSLQQVVASGGIGGPLLSFRNLAQLTSLALDSNQLTGTLPTDFLVNSRFLDQRIEVGLSDNELSGTIPSQWSRFDRLFVDLAGNMITGIHPSLCEIGGWMDGDVGEFQCDGILCRQGTYNEVGRQSDAVSDCVPCSSGTGNNLGAKSCGAEGVEEDSTLNILREFFVATNGIDWLNNENWVDSTDYCSYHGVTCDGSGEVVQIDLIQNGLQGTPPSSIFKLPKLRELLLSNNDLSFSFDGIGEANTLVTLHLDNTNLESVDGVGDAPSLAALNLADNVLNGEIDYQIFLIPTLRELDLGYNLFNGRIPNLVGALTSLEELYLHHNDFTGRLPAALGDLTNLRVLNLAENNFEGTIPREFNDLTNLEFLSIQREGGVTGIDDIGVNQGDSSALGPGLTGPLPAFANFPYLTELYLGLNSLSGSVPFNFLDGVIDTTLPINVDLTSNRITGTIPASLTQFSELSLFLSDNRITAIADGLCIKADWMNGNVGTYNCDGILCPVGTYNRLGRKTGSATTCDTCATGTNGFMGSFECLSSEDHKENTERAILEKLYSEMRGELWIRSTNWLDPDVSICEWFGITCVSADEESVIIIDLESNRLHHELPTEVYSLPNLRELNLQGNAVAILFDGIENAINLEYIDIEGVALTSLSGIEAAPGLKVLRVDGNAFESFPAEIFELTDLEVLSMSNNAFPGQQMPPALQSLSNLKYFSCSGCGFVGPIPTWLGSIANLEYIRLDQNLFTGTLPTELEQLQNIKHIDFSESRRLNGQLLDFASQTQLSELYLQHNSFTGTIPPTLLLGLTDLKYVTIDLRFNRLNGAIPTELGRFTDLNLFIASNNFEVEIPQELCNLPWNDGNTAEHGCDAIMCDKGTFNAFGRAVGSVDCLPCESGPFNDYYGSAGCGQFIEHSFFISLYRFLGGPNWKSDQNWLRSEDHCTWEGVTCHTDGDHAGLVKEINLEDNNLVGTLPFYSQLWSLVGLEYLNLQKNEIIVEFRMIGNAINLQTMILSETNTNSMEYLGEATSLTSLHLTNANLGGSIPEEFYRLTNLEELYLSHNDLTGTLSTRIGNMRKLRDVYIFGNKLTGALPTELGFLARAEHLSLGENKFRGSIPRQMTSLPLLEVLSLQMEEDPEFDGPFAVGGGGLSGTLPALDGFPRIRELYLGYNSFTGTIPDHFLGGIQDKSQKLVVDLSFNSIDGIIPSSLASFDDLQILLAANNIYAIPDEICDKTAWMNGEVKDGCDAILCEPGTFNQYGRRVDSQTPCEPCTYPGSSTSYGSTECGPTGDLNDRQILFELYDAAGGKGWTNRDGWNDDDVPFCDWYGVKCGAGNLGQPTVTEISLPANRLIGIIPSIIYHLPELKKLDVRRNEVSMQFRAIHQARSLEELYLDETHVSRLDGIGQAPVLKTLHIKKASFNGQAIPDDFFDLSALTDLDLSDSLIAGTLSTRIGDLITLERLAIVGNEISGTIPSEIGLLTSLKVLEISNNNWFGPLPSTLGNLVSLDAFFLDNFRGTTAGVSGALHSFSTMPAIREIHLSNNQLTGTIPEDFLAGVDDPDSAINVFLDSNHLVGTVPSQLSAFKMLNIELADNLFVAIGDGLCKKADWLDGDVGRYDCDGLMCPAGTFSTLGRQTSSDDGCKPCPGAENSPYMGVSTCLLLQKMKEFEILANLYDASGGDDWKNKDGWLDVNTDICDWYGISCSPGSTVESILLGSNHLVGSMPTDIYTLPNLKYLWVYSNPIEISFEGIEQATKLTSLLVDSTKLSSLEGIGRARSLENFDVRFNRLKGTIPTEIGNLVNLESFTISENEFSGSIPNLTALRKLNTVRMSSNQLTGTVPSFAGNPQLKAVDLSENKLEGSIPATFLQTANTEQSVFVDLSENRITGTVPGELRRFHDLTIFLRDNFIEGIDPALCESDIWNGGDVGEFQCDGILCPSGTYSSSGRASKTNGATCEPCDENKFFGSTVCGFSAASSALNAVLPLSLILFSIAGLLL